MKIWLMKPSEPLPCDDNPRLARMGLLADYLARHGHDVTFWTSTFSHGEKKYRFDKHTELMAQPHEKIIMLHVPQAYHRNTSPKRMLYNYRLAQQFYKHAQNQEIPDIILCSWPIMEFASAALKYAKPRDIPVILDIRDLWPDIFVRAVPKGIQKLSRLILTPFQHRASNLLSHADVIIGTTPASLQWGLSKAGRSGQALDQVIYIGYDNSRDLPDEVMQKEITRWGNLGVTPDTYNITFFGSMSTAVIDGGTCIAGFKKLVQKYPDMRLVLCGDGDGLSRNKALAAGCPQIVFPGWCDNAQIQSLLSISNAGLYPMHNLPDFRDTISNKFSGYLAAGLPVISELEGFSKTYIERWQIGKTYQENQPDSFVQAVESLYLDRETAQRLGQNARKRFEADFDAEIVNEKFLRLFEELA